MAKTTKKVEITVELDGILCKKDCRFLGVLQGCSLFNEHLFFRHTGRHEYENLRCKKCLDTFGKG